MVSYLVRRLVGALGVLMLVSTLVFAILQVAGDPASLIVSEGGTQADLDAVRRELGLDQPLPIRYARFLAGIVTLDMGNSFHYTQPALGIVLERLPATLQLTLAALGIAALIGVPLGIVAAARQDSSFDHAISFVAFLGQAAPNFWIGAMLIMFFAVQQGLLPTSGMDGPKHLILPAVTLALRPLSQFTRLTRSEVLEAIGQDYVRTAHAKGLRGNVVLRTHVLKNAAIPIVTLVGLDLGMLLAGAVVVESVFAWPGSGRLLLQAIGFRDFPVIQASVLVLAAMVVFINLAVDLLYARLDPRIRLS